MSALRRFGTTRSRGRYRKAEDAGIIAQVRRIVDRRPTYGYRRKGLSRCFR